MVSGSAAGSLLVNLTGPGRRPRRRHKGQASCPAPQSRAARSRCTSAALRQQFACPASSHAPPRRVHTAALPDAQATAYSYSARQIHSANFPLDQDNRTYHVGTKKGEVANCILAVGSVGRARMFAQMLQPLPGAAELLMVESSRGFLTVTGAFRGVPVSVITHLMGFGNIDIMLRETRAVVDGPIYVVRIGTCGSLNGKVGQLMIASEGAVAIMRDPDAFHPPNGNGGAAPPANPYRITRPVPASRDLTAALAAEATALMGPEAVHLGLNASADSFFSSQGRLDPSFDDRNAGVIEELLRRHPSACSLEMETFHLFHLAECSNGSIQAAAGAISLADRMGDHFIDASLVPQLERKAGEAALLALASTQARQNLTRPPELSGSMSVWAD